MSTVSRHYPYKVHELLKLTPRQIDMMVQSLARETRAKAGVKEEQDASQLMDDSGDQDGSELDINALDGLVGSPDWIARAKRGKPDDRSAFQG